MPELGNHVVAQVGEHGKERGDDGLECLHLFGRTDFQRKRVAYHVESAAQVERFAVYMHRPLSAPRDGSRGYPECVYTGVAVEIAGQQVNPYLYRRKRRSVVDHYEVEHPVG